MGASSFELASRDWDPACGLTIKAGNAGRVAMTGRIDDCSRGICQKREENTCKGGGIHRCAQQATSLIAGGSTPLVSYKALKPA